MPELIPPFVAAHLRSIGIPRKLHKGQELFSQGDDSSTVSLVMAGNLRIVAATSSGRELLLAKTFPGELTGEVTCLLGTERPASAITEDEVEVTTIGHDTFRQALKQHPELATSPPATGTDQAGVREIARISPSSRSSLRQDSA